MSFHPLSSRSFFKVPLFLGLGLRLFAQSQTSGVPANYHGPDTYGLCVYVAGDTTYYGQTFYTSSYYKIKAEQEMRDYAQKQSQGTSVKARCFWSAKESDLATAKEADRRLLGQPGHSAKGVDSGWTFHGATAASATTATNTAAAGTTYTQTAAANTSTGTQNYSRRTSGTSTASQTSTVTTTPVTTSANGVTSTTTSATTNTVTGSAQQTFSDAKNNAVSAASTGMGTATTSAMNGLSTGMANMFHRKQSQPQQGAAAAQANGGSPQVAATPTAAAPTGGFDMGSGSAAPATERLVSTGNTGAGANTATAASVEGLVADVSGNEIIINLGQSAGVQPGTTLAVMHAQRTVKDPATGKVLRTIEGQVGELKITSVDASSAVGTFSGTAAPVVGDTVRLKR